MQEAAQKYHCHIYAFALMTNHVHLLMTPMVVHGISQMMQSLGRRYVYYINKTYKRTGALREGRYKPSLIDSEQYLLTCMQYIELNPVRANMVQHPGEYQWTSYHVNAQIEVDTIIHPPPCILHWVHRKRNNKSLIESCFDIIWMPPQPPPCSLPCRQALDPP